MLLGGPRRRPQRKACRHCGAAVEEPSAAGPEFCCAGCAYVWRLINEGGLEAFYRIKDEPIPPADAAVFEPRSYCWLQQAVGAAEAGAADQPATLNVAVQGVSCAACVWLIERIFVGEPGAREIVVNAQRGTIWISWIPGRFDGAAWGRRLQKFGYAVGPGGQVPEVLESSVLVRRIGLCAAFALNVMLFALPAYFGMDPGFRYAGLFRLLALILATFSLLAGGTYFIARAFRAAVAGTVHIDQPIAIGIVGAYLGSLAGWVFDLPRLFYPDFVATFIVLMLVGRWAQVAAVERNRRRLLRSGEGAASIRLRDGTSIPRESLAAGQRFTLPAGATVPVQARLEGGAGEFSLASISGEGRPQLFRAGHTVPAGAVSLNRLEVGLCALEPWSASLLAQLLAPPPRSDHRNVVFDRIIRAYVVAIMAFAGAAGLGWWLATRDPARAGAVAVAVLVVSCPCAIGLAVPLADELAVLEARACGVFVRAASLWRRLGRVHDVVFDKTGTLTLENPVLLNPEALGRLGPEERSALATLVLGSLHPVGRTLHEAIYRTGTPDPTPGVITEEAGAGVQLGPWTLGRSGWRGGVAGQPATVFARDGRLLAAFRFADAVRPGAAQAVADLGRNGRRVWILSGDETAKVQSTARQLGIPPERALGALGPAGKAEWIRGHARSSALMLGDGTNDSLAFDAALCRGTPVIHRGILKDRADFYYLRRGIDGVTDLLAIAAKHRRVQAAVVAFSVAYNLAAAAWAAAGRINPLIAAVLMPASSLVSLAIVVVGMKRGRRAGDLAVSPDDGSVARAPDPDGTGGPVPATAGASPLGGGWAGTRVLEADAVGRPGE